jgi:hypothetical protein
MEKPLSDLATLPAASAAVSSDISIVILDRGFVLVGKAQVDGDWVVTTEASIIRRWGTTKGLGELAAAGPLENTKLDPIGTVRSPLRALIGLVACEPSKWSA